MSDQDDLIGDMIAEIARSHGVAISRDDPVVAVVLLNQIVLRRYLKETVAPAADAIRTATQDAITQIERIAEAQAHWLDQVSLKDRASFLEDQKALHETWKAEMRALIEGQNSALQQVVMQTVSLLRVPSEPAAAETQPLPTQSVTEKRGILISPRTLLGTGAAAILALAFAAWINVAAH